MVLGLVAVEGVDGRTKQVGRGAPAVRHGQGRRTDGDRDAAERNGGGRRRAAAPAFADLAMTRWAATLSGPATPGSGAPGLSGREEEVPGLLASGLTNNEIAGRLGLSLLIVNRHVANVYVRLGTRNRPRPRLGQCDALHSSHYPCTPQADGLFGRCGRRPVRGLLILDDTTTMEGTAMATTTINDTTINYTDTGTGAPPLLLVHGFGGNLHHFDMEAPTLARDHRVVAIDRAGHGESGMPDGELTVDLFADELAGLCEELGLHRVVLVQHGFDKVAYELAARRPDLVGGLVILDGPTVPGPDFEAGALAMAEGLEGDGWLGAVRTFSDRWIFPPEVSEADRAGAMAMVSAAGQRVLASSWRGFVSHDARPALRSLTCPMLYVAGIFPCDLDVLRQEVPQVEVAEIRGRGHMLTFTAADEVVDLVAGFASRIAPASVDG